MNPACTQSSRPGRGRRCRCTVDIGGTGRGDDFLLNIFFSHNGSLVGKTVARIFELGRRQLTANLQASGSAMAGGTLMSLLALEFLTRDILKLRALRHLHHPQFCGSRGAAHVTLIKIWAV